MIKKIIDNIFEKKGKKEIVNLLITIIILCILGVLCYNTVYPDKKETRHNEDKINNLINNNQEINKDYTDVEEKKLKEILSNIKGVGNVEVMITYESTKEIVPALNTTESNDITEGDNSNGTDTIRSRTDSTKSVVISNSNEVIILKEIQPKVKGVMVVAEGVDNIVVKNNIINAVSALFDIPINKIVVFDKK